MMKYKKYENLDDEFDEITNETIEEALTGLVKKGFVQRETFESGETYYSLTPQGKALVDKGSILIEDTEGL